MTLLYLNLLFYDCVHNSELYQDADQYDWSHQDIGHHQVVDSPERWNWNRNDSSYQEYRDVWDEHPDFGFEAYQRIGLSSSDEEHGVGVSGVDEDTSEDNEYVPPEQW